MVRSTIFPTITQFRHLPSVSTAQWRAPNVTSNITIFQRVPTCFSAVRKQKINTEISYKTWHHCQNLEFFLIKEIKKNKLTVKHLPSIWTKAPCLIKEAVTNGDNTGHLAQISLPSQLVLKGRGSTYRQPAGSTSLSRDTAWRLLVTVLPTASLYNQSLHVCMLSASLET